MPSSSPQSISLALQGGGTHAAYTWGVLDQLFIDGRFAIDAISATSGGALMAAVLAQGLHDGGGDGARTALLKFWHKVRIASSMLPIRMNIADKVLSNVGLDMSASSMALDYITKIFSPYQFNLFDINPLRGIVDEMVDFDLLNQKSPMALYINTTNAKTGKSRVFTDKELSLEVVMASACLPFIFKTVEIEGEPYWDGSFSGCPAIMPLVENHHAPDIVLVQVHPSTIEEVPTAAADILDRTTEIGFNAVLEQELKTVELYNKTSGKEPVTIHRIDASEVIAGLGRASKLNTDWDFIVYLHDLGVQAATDWLDKAHG